MFPHKVHNIRGRVGSNGRTFTGTYCVHTNQMRFDNFEEPSFWLECTLPCNLSVDQVNTEPEVVCLVCLNADASIVASCQECESLICKACLLKSTTSGMPPNHVYLCIACEHDIDATS